LTALLVVLAVVTRVAIVIAAYLGGTEIGDRW
jgi:hypothetical protein